MEWLKAYDFLALKNFKDVQHDQFTGQQACRVPFSLSLQTKQRKQVFFSPNKQYETVLSYGASECSEVSTLDSFCKIFR